MNIPVREQPTSEPRPDDRYVDPYSSIAPYGSSVILGPIVTRTTQPNSVGPQPTLMMCHMCGQDIKTVIYHRPTFKTHLFSACLCIMGCWPCMCIPYCMHSCSKTDHYCPYCSAFLGSFTLD